MSSEFWFLIYVFAIYRFAELVSNDLIFESFRKWVGKRVAAGRSRKFFADFINCPLCIGVWLSFPAALLFTQHVIGLTTFKNVSLIWLGMAGMQYLLSSLFLEKN